MNMTTWHYPEIHQLEVSSFHSLHVHVRLLVIFLSMLDDFGLLSLPDVVISLTIFWHQIMLHTSTELKLYLVSLMIMSLSQLISMLEEFSLVSFPHVVISLTIAWQQILQYRGFKLYLVSLSMVQLEVHICNFHSLYDDCSSMLDEFGLMSLPDVVMSLTISWHHPVGLQRVRSLHLVSLNMMMLPAQRVWVYVWHKCDTRYRSWNGKKNDKI